MKKSYLNREQRQIVIWHETKQAESFIGSVLILNLELKKFCREIGRSLFGKFMIKIFGKWFMRQTIIETKWKENEIQQKTPTSGNGTSQDRKGT